MRQAQKEGKGKTSSVCSAGEILRPRRRTKAPGVSGTTLAEMIDRNTLKTFKRLAFTLLAYVVEECSDVNGLKLEVLERRMSPESPKPSLQPTPTESLIKSVNKDN